QHAEALLASNLTGHVEDASSEISAKLKSYVDGYLSHAEQTMRKEVSSCVPLRNIAFASKAAVCSEILDPINGYWASLLLCLLLTMPMIMLATSLRDLYANTEAYTDYIISQSMDTTPSHRRVSAFMTDTYDHTYRRLNGHSGKRGDQIYATGNYRTPSSTSTYFDDVGTVGNP
uniref:Uncharacterized protein n=1 Tax=Plectus sambesii TaxID=2011161 RepID=A0A914VFA9_9BILA